MELESYIDLYLAETEESLRLLNTSLLALEGEDAQEADLDEAFRAAHTIKGTAAMMGFPEVAEVAHELEDLLEALRSGTRELDGALIDELLEIVDRLERKNQEAVTAPAEESGSASIIHIEFTAECELRSARAAVVVRKVEEFTEILGTVPPDLTEEFEGGLQLFVSGELDFVALTSAIESAGDIASVEIEEVEMTDLAEILEAVSASAAGEAESDPDGTKGKKYDGLGRRLLRISPEHLDALADGVADLGILTSRLEVISRSVGDPLLTDLASHIRRRVTDLEHTTQEARMVPVGEVFHRFPRLVRDTARHGGKEVDFEIEGQGLQADRRVLEEVTDPLIHLLRDAVDHGIESPDDRVAVGKPRRGRLQLRAIGERANLLIEIEDDGRGISREAVTAKAEAMGIETSTGPVSDDELLRLMSHPGLSTAGKVTDISGRGVGLDAVVTKIRALGGAVVLQTEEGKGTTFRLQLPASLTLTQALRVRVAGEDYTIPLTHVSEVVALDDTNLRTMSGGEAIGLRGRELPLIRLGRVLLGYDEPSEVAAVVIEVGERSYALAVDELVGREQVVVRGFTEPVGLLPIFSGATLLGDGRPALVLDPTSV